MTDPAVAPDRADALPTTVEGWEQLRRSVAMLPTGAWALRREPALVMLSGLITALRRQADQE